MQSTVFRGHVAACWYSSVVGMSVCVCLCVGHDREPCKYRWTDRHAIWAGADSRGFKKRCIYIGGSALWHHPANAMDRSVWQRRGVLSLPLLQQLIIGTWQSWAILVNFDWLRKSNRTMVFLRALCFKLSLWQTALQRRENLRFKRFASLE